jgi:hypothetical protein
MAIVKDELKEARLENVAADTTPGEHGRVVYNTGANNAQLDDGTYIRNIHDDKSKIGLKYYHSNGANYIIDTDVGKDMMIYVTTGGATRTVFLPSIVSNLGRIFIIYKLDADSPYPVLIDADGTDTIQSANNYYLYDKDSYVVLKAYPDDWKVIGGTSRVIQNYIAVGDVGDTNQFMAGHDYSLAELQHFFGAANIYSYNRFGAGAALVTDETGNYDYTLGAAGAAPSNSTGIMNTAYAISFDGGDYATSATKFDDFTTFFTDGFIHSFWYSLPADGQPAAESQLFYKENSAIESYSISIATSGQIGVVLQKAGNPYYLYGEILPNGANTIWMHAVVCWDTTYGARFYINGKMIDMNSALTTLMIDGSTGDFYIGASSAVPATPLTGKIANEVVINKLGTQYDIDLLFSATRPEPANLANRTYSIKQFIQPEGDTNFEYQGLCDVVAKYDGNIYIAGGQYGATDKIKLVGGV